MTRDELLRLIAIAGHFSLRVCLRLIMWLRPVAVLATAVLGSLVLAVYIEDRAPWLLAQSTELTRWMVAQLNRLPWADVPMPPPPKDLRHQFDLSIAAIGATAMIGILKDVVSVLLELWSKWNKPDLALLTSAFLKTMVAVTGLWLSAYGLEKLAQNGPSQTLTIEAALMPPVTIDPVSGQLRFYVGFYDEGGQKTFDSPATHGSIRVSKADQTFLSKLKDALAQCGTAANPVQVRIDGFASGSPWTNVERDLQSRNDIAKAKAAPTDCSTDPSARNPGLPRTPGDALSCIEFYGATQASSTGARTQYDDSDAFNVYLGNMRRLEVAERLGLTDASGLSAVKLTGKPWNTFSEMESAMVVDDRNARGSFATVGLLTRSARITIEQPADCAKSSGAGLRRTQLVLQ